MDFRKYSISLLANNWINMNFFIFIFIIIVSFTQANNCHVDLFSHMGNIIKMYSFKLNIINKYYI